MNTDDLLFSFSKALLCFSKNIKNIIKNVLTEINIKVNRTNFVLNNYKYPINIIIFEHSTKMGFFNHDLLEIGINKYLMLQPDSLLLDIVKHELAHFLTYIEYGNTTHPHGEEFKKICTKYNWKKESSASIKIDEYKKHNTILKKISKLLNLSASSNINESKSAMQKVKDLLIKYQIQHEIQDDQEEFTIKRIIKQTKSSQKLIAIIDILQQFFVFPVINHGKNFVYLEVFGSQVNVEVAEYIAIFLNRKLDELWDIEKKKNTRLNGIVAKNSFFRGVAQGFTLKNNSNKHKSIIKINTAITKQINLAYPRLSKSPIKINHDKTTFDIGKKIGKTLEINTSIKNSSKNIFLITANN